MLRMESDVGWWLTTHSDQAKLAGEIAAAWGNDDFRRPEPRERVLLGISSVNSGWSERDGHPVTGREGRPAAFSIDLAARQSAFEEIDLQVFLAIRDQSARSLADQDPYAALMVALHTENLLRERTDRSLIESNDLIKLDDFLEAQPAFQEELRTRIEADPALSPADKSQEAIVGQFQFLQACETLALLACVAYASPASLVHPLSLNSGETAVVKVLSAGPRAFRLHPWPFAEESLSLEFPSRHVKGKMFLSSDDLVRAYEAAPVQQLTLTLTP